MIEGDKRLGWSIRSEVNAAHDFGNRLERAAGGGVGLNPGGVELWGKAGSPRVQQPSKGEGEGGCWRGPLGGERGGRGRLGRSGRLGPRHWVRGKKVYPFLVLI
jgi:hypothetical protein